MIYIVTGAIESGKTKSIKNWIKGRNDTFGILTPNDTSNSRILLDIATKETYAMQAVKNNPQTISVGRYTFYKSAFSKGNALIQTVLNQHTKGYVIIDELGKLELRNQGFYIAAKLLINSTEAHKNLHSILIIRDYLLDEIIAHFGIKHYKVLNNIYQLDENTTCVT